MGFDENFDLHPSHQSMEPPVNGVFSETVGLKKLDNQHFIYKKILKDIG